MAKMEMWKMDAGMGRIFHSILLRIDSLKGQLFQADDIMEEYEEQIGDVKGYSDFMNQISLFTGWYAWSTRINNRFGNYVPESL